MSGADDVVEAMVLDEHVEERKFMWVLFFVQAALGSILILRGVVLSCMGWTSLCHGKNEARDEAGYGDTCSDSEITDDIDDNMEAAHSFIHDALIHRADTGKSALANAKKERDSHYAWQKARHMGMQSYKSIFLGHTRSEDNFIRGNDDPAVVRPPGSPMEIEREYYSRMLLYGYLRQPLFLNVFARSLGWAFIAGALGTFLSIYTDFRDSAKTYNAEWVDAVKSVMGGLLGDVKWLPTFMLTGYLAFYLQRWRNFIFAAWNVEGRLKDLGIVVGSDARDPTDAATRRLMFRIYRYMVLAMALQYKVFLPRLRDAGADLCAELEKRGLLTPQETVVLRPQGSRMRDAVLSWIALEIKQNGPSKTGLLLGNSEITCMDKLTALRGQMMFFHGNNFYPQPNVWSAFLTLLVDLNCGVMILGYPFKSHVPVHLTRFLGFQPFTVVSVFIMTSCFWGAYSIVQVLANPFSNRLDTFNIDALIAGTEETIFCSMRAGFDTSARHQKTT